jgi:hypothetical protein
MPWRIADLSSIIRNYIVQKLLPDLIETNDRYFLKSSQLGIEW